MFSEGARILPGQVWLLSDPFCGGYVYESEKEEVTVADYVRSALSEDELEFETLCIVRFMRSFILSLVRLPAVGS